MLDDCEFAKQRGMTVGNVVMDNIDAMEDDEMDVELTTENLASVAGGQQKVNDINFLLFILHISLAWLC